MGLIMTENQTHYITKATEEWIGQNPALTKRMNLTVELMLAEVISWLADPKLNTIFNDANTLHGARTLVRRICFMHSMGSNVPNPPKKPQSSYNEEAPKGYFHEEKG